MFTTIKESIEKWNYTIIMNLFYKEFLIMTTCTMHRILKYKTRKGKLMDLAKKSKEKQLINTWIEPCDDEDCKCKDKVFKEYAMPDGSLQIEKTCLNETN